MRPRDSVVREACSLIVWWALWSLADAYLLEWTPVFELVALGFVGTWMLTSMSFEALAAARRREWTSATLVIEEAEGAAARAAVVSEAASATTRL